MVPSAEHCPCSQGGQGEAGWGALPNLTATWSLNLEGGLRDSTILSIY